ncbi:hypothetical protein [Paraburkholderia kirstenboschensis]|uniref:Uncharacterized protein n=1 Tax=Paraburkholderia kirstenboschensis TaxID=1245436 RepID=A0ABZ0ELU7_9BURK|nr:hypothetical protein [Paraburkholderia kirstenboschensis]WOD18147.1 hypothetical protein RW095_35885 [Paraburkholderia kirstenboschensis]
MSEEMKTIKAGPFTLVARFIDNAYRGVMWADGEMVVDIRRATLDEVWRALCDALYEQQISLAAARLDEPTAAEIAKVFVRIAHQLTAGHKAMLRAHLNASDQRITATQLAKAADYATYSAANLQYGILGAMLFAELPIDLPMRKDGSRVMTCTIAWGDNARNPDEEHWVWRMRPYVAEGLAASGIL